MQAICTYLSVALLLFLSTTAAQDDDIRPFRLRAQNARESSPGSPIFNHYVQVNDSGYAVIDTTANYAGFDSYLDPEPEGELRKRDNSYWGFLWPVNTGSEDPDHYILQFDSEDPGSVNGTGTLYTNFTSTDRPCGPDCTMPTLNYDEGEDSKGYGLWYVLPIGGDHPGVWDLRWTRLVEGQPVPSGGVEVLVWKNWTSVPTVEASVGISARWLRWLW
ncbi:hypothetical protein BDZ91DRAFT_736600 [Kalaharituber pfeilii]|nr:hypothetical protein BDZ91DRAFT_736600 [Kalaharituber pfeilii]